jgi:hypothetical protein
VGFVKSCEQTCGKKCGLNFPTFREVSPKKPLLSCPHENSSDFDDLNAFMSYQRPYYYY